MEFLRQEHSGYDGTILTGVNFYDQCTYHGFAILRPIMAGGATPENLAKANPEQEGEEKHEDTETINEAPRSKLRGIKRNYGVANPSSL